MLLPYYIQCITCMLLEPLSFDWYNKIPVPNQSPTVFLNEGNDSRESCCFENHTLKPTISMFQIMLKNKKKRPDSAPGHMAPHRIRAWTY